ncbi:MAG: virulence RhuM family protein [Opitutaceae bacterium]|nr:virulence RhuM family protein [Opitutaceae bacterium]
MIIYETDDKIARVSVRLEDESVWLAQQQLAELFQTSRTNVVEHIKHIYKEGELDEAATCRKFRQVQTEGNRSVERELPFYNLDMIISLGYRINSKVATRFRQWATIRLREYIIKGFTMDDDRLKNPGGGDYWKELLERIRDIRTSEKVFHRQILDIYATSIDYDPSAGESVAFFKKVQNKIHYAIHGKTAAEVIHARADAEKDFMGLMTFAGNRPHLADAVIAKNYLTAAELRALGQLVSGYLDFAERQAGRHVPMTMRDWASHLDTVLTATGEQLLIGAGRVSHGQALEKARTEYVKYQARTLSDVEKQYLDSLKTVEAVVKKRKKK